RDRNAEEIVSIQFLEAHQSGTFPWCQTTRAVLLVIRIIKIFFSPLHIPAAVNQDFRTVFMITGRKGSCHAARIFRIYQTKPKTVTFGLMFLGIVVKILPEVFSQYVLVCYFRF